MDYSQLIHDLETLETAAHQVKDRRIARKIKQAMVDTYLEIYTGLSDEDRLAIARGLRSAELKLAGKVLHKVIGGADGWSAAIYKPRHAGCLVVEYYIGEEYLEGQNYTTDSITDALAEAERRVDPQNRPWG